MDVAPEYRGREMKNGGEKGVVMMGGGWEEPEQEQEKGVGKA